MSAGLFEAWDSCNFYSDTSHHDMKECLSAGHRRLVQQAGSPACGGGCDDETRRATIGLSVILGQVFRHFDGV